MLDCAKCGDDQNAVHIEVRKVSNAERTKG
jgi:hypothetical protein